MRWSDVCIVHRATRCTQLQGEDARYEVKEIWQCQQLPGEAVRKDTSGRRQPPGRRVLANRLGSRGPQSRLWAPDSVLGHAELRVWGFGSFGVTKYTVRGPVTGFVGFSSPDETRAPLSTGLSLSSLEDVDQRFCTRTATWNEATTTVG